jgi:2-polyprenyl-6-methoxyphenol hydroxylase-like FAD-dependent oxidoreductase
MPAVDNALVVGAGAAGCATAILLAEAGIAVDLIEINPSVIALGSGITVQGNALRVLRQLGVWPAVEAAGYSFNVLGLRAPDGQGTLIAEIADVRSGGQDLPATVGMYRPDLARILTDRALSVGTKIHYGTTLDALSTDETGVDVRFAGGSTGRYDLLVGADGVRSRTRSLLGIPLETRPIGMGIWRAFTKRPASVTRTDLIYGGPCFIAGYCPTGEDSLYCYLVEPAQDRSGLTGDQQLAVMRQLSEAYHGPWDDIREGLTDPTRLNYRHFEHHVLPRPWNRGRVVLIGDAAHICPPTLAQGAAMALEDAAVLAELVASRDTIDQSLWDAFMDRRFERAGTVVAASMQLAGWLLDHERGDVAGLISRTMTMLVDPA